MTPEDNTPKDYELEDALRPHSYDGIQEYDKRLPNWWLMTFYGSIIFSVAYFACYEWWKALPDQEIVLRSETARIDAIKLSSVASLSDATLWQMSRNPTFVAAGQATFLANCATCHKPDLSGNIGPLLIKPMKSWINGGRPMQIYTTITTGVAAKGMPTWGPLLGTKKITEAAAFILSKNQANEKDAAP
jgi:cytochrome c oxidase cbb3-type subunit 3